MVTSFTRELGMALAWEGFDVDLIPYGQPLAASDLQDVSLVVLLPTVDYPGDRDETWGDAELALLESYVSEGGFLLVTNSNLSMAMTMPLQDPNEDALDINALLEPMGVRFSPGSLRGDSATAKTDHPLNRDAPYLAAYNGNGVPFSMSSGVTLYEVSGHPIIALLEFGKGRVLVVADISLLIVGGDAGRNFDFVWNIAKFVHPK
jgi:hypothetical protein